MLSTVATTSIEAAISLRMIVAGLVVAIVTGLLFLVTIFAAPYAGLVPLYATAPALILVGSLMMAPLVEVSWEEPFEAVPAFLTLALIPLTFSIANGIAIGFISYTIIKILAGKWGEINWAVILVAVLGVLHYAYG